MPFLRVIRDKRGYETTYLMHWYREGQRQRTRILYVFRSPGGVRVGRQVLEPEVMRWIEAENPDIEFEWAAVRENKQVIDSSPEPRRARRSSVEAPARPQKAPQVDASASTPIAPKPAIPSALQGATLDDQIAFLGIWYPQVRDRVIQRASDPGRREALLALAERLNTASWTGADAEQIATRLRHASEALERLSHVFARRRRRTRKRVGEPVPAADATPSEEQAGATDSPGEASDSGPLTEPPPSAES